ncbi:MAG: hypothetical protein QNJ32_25385 [Xenococcaceae cyanobacterium MO_167.B27]|nr:hypothetical protein [Xenococcaceae cyanobacterium MO_167.B27]
MFDSLDRSETGISPFDYRRVRNIPKVVKSQHQLLRVRAKFVVHKLCCRNSDIIPDIIPLTTPVTTNYSVV